jgi:hypothetical protein
VNLTWLYTNASRNRLQNILPIFSETYSGTLLNVNWLCTKTS